RAALAGIAYASMAIVTLAYPAPAFPRPLEGSGYLVPAVDGHPVKAVTFSSVKWPHLRSADPAMTVVRCSLGRVGEERLLQRDAAHAGRYAGQAAPHPAGSGFARIRPGQAFAAPAVADNGGMPGTDANPAGERQRARDLNELIRYTMWSVFRLRSAAALEAGRPGREALAAELEGLLDQAAGKGVTTRGCYDVQGLRADADYMFWWIAPSPDDLQELYARFRRTR